jgi:hypothetical protein
MDMRIEFPGKRCDFVKVEKSGALSLDQAMHSQCTHNAKVKRLTSYPMGKPPYSYNYCRGLGLKKIRACRACLTI